MRFWVQLSVGTNILGFIRIVLLVVGDVSVDNETPVVVRVYVSICICIFADLEICQSNSVSRSFFHKNGFMRAYVHL